MVKLILVKHYTCFIKEDSSNGLSKRRNEIGYPFQRLKYSIGDDKCQCQRCNIERRNQWPYKLSLSANLLWLLGEDFHSINYDKAKTFEATLISQYLRDHQAFWNYITEVCVHSGEHGLQLFEAFKNRSFDKVFVHDRMTNRPRRYIPQTNRTKTLEKLYKRTYQNYRNAF
ncbi:unnamed protein product [Rotaria socialis]|uniref:Uncharacterized protein n=1 Tax=Rotaria socialis TaxID=392032 RepID=A0A818VJM4_9BILA|nr:unnamed protein product [Rotaria socialis]CAF3241333.1 unnamed protein product [Rotaria socialis]CAF3713413.1 unnamed protein product [Rotaria socialis]CAF4453891.1 unnamed protein product [Rotaria socialis]CAF4565637.1 unnamed protein product [Rotaria socialis]